MVYTSISISLALFFSIVLYHIISTMFSTTWMRSLINKATQRKVLGDAQTTLLLGDYDNYTESAAVAPTSTIVEISPEHSTQDSRNIDLHDPSSFTSLDIQSPPEMETLVGNNNIT
jgi:hypothetical protein